MASTEESPLITALPPHTDYISYLTIVEQYLTKQNLSTLHTVLQNEELTTNIGWDLILVLVPLLPESEECLQDVARLGNPREVILKVTEALRLIDFEPDLEDEEDKVVSAPSTSQLDGSSVKEPKPAPLWLQQFTLLISILPTLHARIKTKYPSRFLSGSLQAVLASFSASTAHHDEMVDAIVHMIKTMAKVARPTLPSRSSSGMMSSRKFSSTALASDPEAAATTYDPEEEAVQTRLYQSFITHILEEYLMTLTPHSNVPAMAWSSRIMEKLHSERTIPHSTTISSQFAKDEVLHDRIDIIGQLVSLAHDLKLSDNDLLNTATKADHTSVNASNEEDAPPETSASIPLSHLGSIFLYTARQASTILYDRPSTASSFAIFPQHRELLHNALLAASSSGDVVGTEPDAVIDTCLALGLLALENDNIGTPISDEQFNEYLQTASLLASNCPNANLRGHAHYLTSTILRSHPDEKVRYAFIRDTLEHCPFENLKTTAVGWLKGEIVEANLMKSPASQNGQSADSFFSGSLCLETVAPYLFPALQAELVTAQLRPAWITYQTNVSFYLAVLNFLYLLISAEPLRANLDVSDLWKDHDIGASFLQPLREAKGRFEKAITEKDNSVIEGTDARGQDQLRAELNVLGESIERVTEAAKLLN